MAEIKDIKEARRKRNSQKAVKKVIIFALLISIIFAALVIKETVSRENFAAGISDFFSSMGRGEGFPLTIPGSQSVNVTALNNGAAVLTQTQVMVYSDSGKTLLSELHGFSNPRSSSVGNKTIVYDRGGTGVKVYSKTKLLFSETFENTIYGVFMSKKYIAVVTASQSHSCEVIVYTTSYKQIMKWSCASGRVTALSIDDTANRIFASVVDANGGDFVTTVYKLNVTKKEEESSVKLQGVLALYMKRDGRGTEIIGDKRVVLVSSDMSVSTVYEYEDKSIFCFKAEENGKTILALSEGENDKANNIIVLDSGKEEAIVLSVDENIEALDFNSKNLVYISEGKLTTYNFKKGETKSTEVDIDTFSIAMQSGDVYILGVTKLSKMQF